MMNHMTRRGFGSIAAAGLLSLTGRRAATAQTIYDSPALCSLFGRLTEAFEASLEGAFSLLNTMADAYAAGNTVRLIRVTRINYSLLTRRSAFTYDTRSPFKRTWRGARGRHCAAAVLGEGLVHAQATNFPVSDGRFAQGYYVNVADASGAFITPAAYPFYFYSSSVGDQAWAGMALAHLYHRTRNAAFLSAALKVGNWIVANAYDTQGPGGYRFGTVINPSNQSVPSGNGKSTDTISTLTRFSPCSPQLTKGRRCHERGVLVEPRATRVEVCGGDVQHSRRLLLHRH